MVSSTGVGIHGSGRGILHAYGVWKWSWVGLGIDGMGVMYLEVIEYGQ